MAPLCLRETTLETERAQRTVRKPEIVSQEGKLAELGMFNWKRRKLRDLNFFRLVMKKRK